MCLTKHLNPALRLPAGTSRGYKLDRSMIGVDPSTLQQTTYVSPQPSPQYTYPSGLGRVPIQQPPVQQVAPTAAPPVSAPVAPPVEKETLNEVRTPVVEESKYQYRDFSRVQPDEGESVLDVIAHMPSSTGGAPTGTSAHGIKHQKLPIKLNAMLADKELSHIIAWMPHGRSWRILKPKQFVKEVLPKYFDYCNYNSFIRLVNAWGFRRFSSGPDRHSYYHELFLRNLPHLHSRMRRVTGKDKKPPIDQDDEPDLYEITRSNPLPEDESVAPAPASPPVQTAAPSTTQSQAPTPVAAVQTQASVSPQGAAPSWQSSMAGQAMAAQNISNPYAAALAAQMQQQTQRQAAAVAPHTMAQVPSQAWPYNQYQGMTQFNSVMNPQSVASVQSDPSPPPPPVEQYNAAPPRLSMQQLLQQMDASRMQQLLQSALLNQHSQSHTATHSPPQQPSSNRNDMSMLTHGHGPKNSRGESPIMYIPVYPSTLASLTNHNASPGNVPSDQR